MSGHSAQVLLTGKSELLEVEGQVRQLFAVPLKQVPHVESQNRQLISETYIPLSWLQIPQVLFDGKKKLVEFDTHDRQLF